MRDIIEKIIEGDDAAFEPLMEAVAGGTIYVFAREEDDGLSVDFLTYALEDPQDIEYIPIFTDHDEVDDFLEDGPVSDEYSLYEFDGALFTDTVDPDQYIMINPISGGIVFQGGHLKAVHDGDEEAEDESAGPDTDTPDTDDTLQ